MLSLGISSQAWWPLELKGVVEVEFAAVACDNDGCGNGSSAQRWRHMETVATRRWGGGTLRREGASFD